MTWIFVWDTNPSKIYVGDTQVSKVFVGNTQVRPTWWQPWANTVAYYPLDSTNTINDLSWNSRNLTKEDPYGNVQFWTNDNVDCCYMNWGRLKFSSMPSISSWTILLYINTHNSSNNTNAAIIDRQFNSTYSYWALKLYSSWTDINYYYPTALNSVWNYQMNNTKTTWILWTMVKDGSSYKIYNNDTLVETKSWYGGNTSSTFYIGQDGQNGSYYYCGSISNVIIEDRVWTTQEIQDYFNETKANYWIS